MTDSEINIAVAELCGWKQMQNNLNFYQHDGKHIFHKSELPNYAADLNACAEMEKYFDDKSVDEKSLYYDYLTLEATQDGFPRNVEESHWKSDWAILRATARQRAEAFLKVKE